MDSISHSVMGTWEAEIDPTDSVLIRFKIIEVREGRKEKRVEEEGRERKINEKNLKVLYRNTYGTDRHK